MRTFFDKRFGDGETDFFDLYLPDQEAFDLLIWFHGGGLESGNRKSACFAPELTEHGFAVASCEYRMYPTAKFPEYIEDCARAVAFLQKSIGTYGKVGKIFVSGQSAGAYITMMLCMDESYLQGAGADFHKIAGFLSDSAQMTTHFNVLRERGIDTRYERIGPDAPLFHLSEKSSVRNLFLLCYEEDIPCRPEENALFYSAILRILPECRTVFHKLPGSHCNGSTTPNKNGQYPFNLLAIPFMRETASLQE